MHELELKFSVPSYTQANLAKQFDNKTVKKQRLSAYYLDTPGQDLAKHGIALRVRYEDDQWVQTLKTNGDGVAKRVELNLVLPIEATPSTLDIASLAKQLNLDDHEQLSAQLAKKNKVKHDIQITNTGRSPLQISKLQVFNPALGVSLKKSVLQPGETTRLRVTIDKRNIAKKKRHLRILMITNDPMQPKVEMNIKAS